MSDFQIVDPVPVTGRSKMLLPSRIVRSRTIEGPLIRRLPPGPLDDAVEFDDGEDDDADYLAPDESVFNPSMFLLLDPADPGGVLLHGVATDVLTVQFQGFVVQPSYRVENPDGSGSDTVVPTAASTFYSDRTYSAGKWNWGFHVMDFARYVERVRVDFRFGPVTEVAEVAINWGDTITNHISRTGSAQTTGPAIPRLLVTGWLTDDELEYREEMGVPLQVPRPGLTIFIWRVDEVPEDEEEND